MTTARRMPSVPLVALVAIATLLPGCGDEPASPPGSPDNPLSARPSEAQGGRLNEAAAAAGKGDPAAEPSYQALVERQSRRPEQRFTPCNLVTRAEASAIVGRRLAEPVEAPQGPTCIYRGSGRTSFVTVAVEQAPLERLRRRVRDRRDVRIGGRRGVCGTYGARVLYLGMPRGRVLSVTAPCDVAARFAARAAPRLSSADG